MRRSLGALAAVLLLTLPLSGCGSKDKVASSGGSGPGPASSSAASSSSSSAAPASDGASPSGTASTEDSTASSSAASSSAASSSAAVPAGGSGVNSCALITSDVVNQAFATTFQPGVPEPATMGDPNASDCLYQGDGVNLVLAEGTSRASTDLSQDSIGSAALLPGAQEIPGADRGYVYVLSSAPSGSVGNVVLVKGEKGFSITISIAKTLTTDSLEALAKSVLAAIS